MIAEEGPYPMVIEPPDGGWVVQVDKDIESACGEDGIWGASELSTEHFAIDTDTSVFAYGRHFVGKVSSLVLSALPLPALYIYM